MTILLIKSDFETRLYLCHGGFGYLELDVLRNLTYKTFLFPIYALTQLFYLIYVGLNWINNKKNLKEYKNF